jgi:hypothetical protein
LRATSSGICGSIARVAVIGTCENISASIVGTHDSGGTREELVEAHIMFSWQSSAHTRKSEAKSHCKEGSPHSEYVPVVKIKIMCYE